MVQQMEELLLAANMEFSTEESNELLQTKNLERIAC